MSQVQDGTEAAAAALVGSLATFSLIDVLDLLARTGHTGELQVVGRGVDRHVWVDAGDLVDAAGAPGELGEVLFDLACRDEGWFYFSCTTVLPESAERVAVSDVLSDLGPQVEEWRTLTAQFPFDSMVSMSSTTPSGEVQIRGDQWQLLSLVGSPGRYIQEVIDLATTNPLVTLRTLAELIDAGLLAVGPAASAPAPEEVAGIPDQPAPVETAAETPADPAAVVEPASPWSAPSADGAAPAGLDHLPPPPPFADGAPPVDDAEVPPLPQGWVAGAGSPATAAVGAPAAEEGKVEVAHAVMPPPVTADPWSTSLSSDGADAGS